MDHLLTPAEAANILRVKLNTLYTWSYRRQIPLLKVGKLLRFRRGDLESWLNAQSRTVQHYVSNGNLR
jgi:excisionase family DNA binding protein